MTDGKAKAAGAVYRDEAADLMAAAARGNTRQAPPELELTARRAAPDVQLEPRRPLPYPEPIGINDNDGDRAPQDDRQAPRRERRRLSFVELLARIIVAPFYLAFLLGSLAILVLVALRFLA